MSIENLDISSAIGQRLQTERLRMNMTQRQTAEVIGRSLLTYGKYELGETSPNADALHILHTKGFDVFFIVTGKKSKDELPDDQAALLHCWLRLDERGRAAVKQLAQTLSS
ncbi:helix-turn-helix domain-containing protein [Chitinimonas koreensis]|uniref:helix-turn-helix domain-containing protein n=1 Tax=Chitinimonas koreensis TaxID=356302 RepID=UPI00048FA204|nr:helix-turn-helix transcriptional regulator [Chitinimonas koreensis]QNM96409.1 helix-turn-helix transcriptional regulator [Chitinimonas koreensis]